MRLLFVIDHFGSGGAQRQMTNLARGLVTRGHHVEFFVYFPDHDFFLPGIEAASIRVHQVRKKSPVGLAVAIELRRLMKRGQYTAVLAFLETPSIYAELGRIGRRSPPLVVSERSDFPTGAVGARLQIRALLHRIADRVVTNSYACRLAWCERFPALADRVEVAWNGVDLREFVPREFNCTAERPLSVVAVGTIFRYKNVHGVVAALAELKRRGQPLPNLTWIGKRDETPYGRAYWTEVQHAIQVAGVGAHWTWASETPEIEGALGGADLLVHASFKEGMSNVICEALACGCPVMAADIGDNRLLIGNDERGALFNPADPADLADRLEEFSRLPVAHRQAMRAAARDFAERELGLDRSVDRYEDLFRSIARAT